MPEIVLDVSENLGYTLPDATVSARRLKDIQVIREALIQIDAYLADMPNSSNTVTTATLATSNAALLEDVRGGVTTTADTLFKIKTLIDSVDSNVVSLESSLTAVSGTATTANNAVSDLQVSVDALETAVAGIQSTLTSNDGTLDTIQELVNQIKSNTNTLATLTNLSGANNTITQVMSNKTIEAGVFTNGYTEESQVANSGATFTLDQANGSFFVLTLTANAVLTFPSASVPGKGITLLLKQDGTGGRIVSWPGNVLWPAGATPTVTSAANKTDKFVFSSDGSNWLGSVAGQNY